MWKDPRILCIQNENEQRIWEGIMCVCVCVREANYELMCALF